MSAQPEDLDGTLEDLAPSQAVVERIAAREGVDPTELTPLFEAIDPDALDRLVGMAGYSDSPLQIEFPYHGYNVTVTGDGVVHIDEDVAFER